MYRRGLKSKTDMDVLQAFFRARYGKAYGFRFKDWSDYQAVGQTLGLGNGGQIIFQLAKNVRQRSYSYVREYEACLRHGENLIKGVLQSSGYAVDYTTGVVTFTAALVRV